MSKKMKWLGGTKRLKSSAATLGIFPLASDTMPPQPAAGASNRNHTSAGTSGHSRKPQSGRRFFVKRGHARHFPLAPDAMPQSAARATSLNHAATFSPIAFSPTAWRRVVIAACVAAGFSLAAANALAADVPVAANANLPTTPAANTN